MMLEIESLIHKISGQLSATEGVSIVCICTTNPVFLAFSGRSDAPCFVIRPVKSTSDRVNHDLSVRLYQATAALVPETIGLYEHNGADYSVQRGVGGTPWFRLPRTVSTPEQWTTVRNRAIETLHQFHKGVASIPEWTKTIDLGDALRLSYKNFIATGNEPEHSLSNFVDSMAAELDQLGPWEGIFQHGDFGLNNLLFEENKISVVDLEDFGITAAPLYDEFTLALSLNTLAPDRVKSNLNVELAACTQHMKLKHGFNQKVIQGLLLFYLLVRLGAWSSAEKRQFYRRKLLQFLEQYRNNPDAYIDS